MNYRTPESVMKRIDAMLKKGQVVLDHGVSSYEFDHYTYIPASIENNFESQLDLYYKDFDAAHTVKYYLTLTENNLKQPIDSDSFLSTYIHCSWDKRWPTLLEVREYSIY